MGDREASRGVKRPHEESALDTVPLRTGQWTAAEMAFANKVIEYFDKGSLPNCTNGTTLRALLADILHCSPMRISKKYAGDGAIGKRTFTKLSAIDKTQLEELRALELEFHESLQGRARWPLVEWKTLLLGRTGSGGPTRTAGPPAPRQPPSVYGEPPPPPPILGAPGPRPPYMMQPPPVPTPPRGQREVRYSLHELKEHCQPISLGRLAAEPATAPSSASDEVGDTGAPPYEPPSWAPFGGGSAPPRGARGDASLHQEVYGWIPRDLGVPSESDPLAMSSRMLRAGQPRPYSEGTSRRRTTHPSDAQQQLQGQLEYSSATSPFPPDQPLTAETVQQELRRQIQEQQHHPRDTLRRPRPPGEVISQSYGAAVDEIESYDQPVKAEATDTLAQSSYRQLAEVVPHPEIEDPSTSATSHAMFSSSQEAQEQLSSGLVDANNPDALADAVFGDLPRTSTSGGA